MLAIVISLLFGVAALAAIMTVAGSLADGFAHAARILAELNAIEHEISRAHSPKRGVPPPALAAA